ncbi:MAG: AAA family ATPase [Spirochaetota bacterium]
MSAPDTQEAERCLIEQVLRSPTIIAESGLTSADFSDPFASTVWRMESALIAEGAKPDFVLLAAATTDPETQSGIYRLDTQRSLANWEHYAKLIRSASAARQAGRIATQLAEDVAKGNEGAIDAARASLKALQGKSNPIGDPRTAERAIVEQVLRKPSILNESGLTGSDFIDPVSAAIWTAELAIHERGADPDLILLAAEITDPAVKSEVCYLDSALSPANWQHYSRIVHKASGARHLARALKEALDANARGESDTVKKILSELAGARPSTALTPTCMAALGATELHPPEDIVEGIMPRGVVTVLGAHGGIGKSILGLIIAAHVAAGRPWAGLRAMQGKVLCASFEDPAEVCLYRLQEIARVYALDLDKIRENLTLIDASETDGALVRADRNGTMARTELFNAFAKYAEGCSLIIVDNASDTFDGNESSRREVRYFMRTLAQLARKVGDAALLLLVHVDKSYARDSSQSNAYSGSTAWHNSARSRLALKEGKNKEIHLVQEKANFGPKMTDPIRLVFEGTVLTPAGSKGIAETEANTETVRASIEKAIDRGATIPASRSGAPNFYSTLTAYGLDLDKDDVYAAFDRLLDSGAARIEKYKKNYKDKERVILSSASPPVSASVSISETQSLVTMASASPPVLQGGTGGEGRKNSGGYSSLITPTEGETNANTGGKKTLYSQPLDLKTLPITTTLVTTATAVPTEGNSAPADPPPIEEVPDVVPHLSPKKASFPRVYKTGLDSEGSRVIEGEVSADWPAITSPSSDSLTGELF